MKQLLLLLFFLPLFVTAQKSLEEPIMVLPGHTNDVDVVSVSSRGQIATGAWDKQINIYADDSSMRLIKTLDAHLAPVTAIKYSKDGGLLASGANDFTVRIWDSTYKLFRVLEDHKGNINSLLFDNSRKFLLSGSEDRTIKMWEVSSGKLMRTINHQVSVHAMLQNPADLRQLIVAGAEPKIKVYNMQNTQIVKTFDGHTDHVNAIDINKKGTLMISGSNDKSARIWDLKTGKEIRKLPVDCWKVTAVAFTEDGNHAVTGCNDGSIKIWEVATGKLMVSVEGKGNYVRDLAFSKTTYRLLAASMVREGTDFGLRVWFSGLNVPAALPDTPTKPSQDSTKLKTTPVTPVKPSNAAPKKP